MGVEEGQGKPRRFARGRWMHRASCGMLTVHVQTYRQHIWAVSMAILICRKLHKQRKCSSTGLSHFLSQEHPKQIPQRMESFSLVPEEMQLRPRRTFQVKVKSTELL